MNGRMRIPPTLLVAVLLSAAYVPAAYYLGESQLFHVHNFRGGLRATVFAGGTKLVPVILDSRRIPQEYRDQLAKSCQGPGIKQIKVDLSTMEDVAALMELARLKHEFLKQRVAASRTKRRNIGPDKVGDSYMEA